MSEREGKYQLHYVHRAALGEYLHDRCNSAAAQIRGSVSERFRELPQSSGTSSALCTSRTVSGGTRKNATMLPANEKDKGPTDLEIPYAVLTTFEQIALQQHECELPWMLQDITCTHVEFEHTCDQCRRFLMAGMAPLDEHEPEAAEAAARSAIEEMNAVCSKRNLDNMLEDITSDHSEIGMSAASKAALDEHDTESVQAAASATMEPGLVRGGVFFGVKDVDVNKRVMPHGEHKCFGCTTHKLLQRVISGL